MTDKLKKMAEEIVSMFYPADKYNIDGPVEEVLKTLLSVREEAIKEAADQVPTSWSDPFLSGPFKLIEDSPSQEIEALLLGIKKSIEALLPQVEVK